MDNQRPLVFIGSSAEGLPVAKAVQAELEHCAECVIWHQGIFGLSEGTLEALVTKLPSFDFAVLVLTPDDLVASRDNQQPAPRDNVLLELGLCIGQLGRERSYMVVDRTAKLRLPTDLAGITPATFQPPQAGTMRSAVGPACTDIAASINRLGPRSPHTPVAISGSFFRDVILGDGISVKVKNLSNRTFPPYQISLFHPEIGSWAVFPSAKSGQLLPDQEREHRCPVIAATGELPFYVRSLRKRASQFTESDFDAFAIRFLLEDSQKVLYENKRVGRAIARLIAEANAFEDQTGNSQPWDDFWESFRDQ